MSLVSPKDICDYLKTVLEMKKVWGMKILNWTTKFKLQRMKECERVLKQNKLFGIEFKIQ